MQRWVSISVGLVAVALAIALTVKASHPAKGDGDDSSIRTTDAGGAVDGGTHVSSGAPGGPELRVDERSEGPGSAGVESGVAELGDGLPVPPLPRSAPRQVRFGVVLVSYLDAQPELTGGHTTHRSHADAKILADRLAGVAAQDFHAAVQQGDTGSTDDVGTVKLGILEPAAEYVLFTLPVDGVGGPVDTPRGYWIVKRLE